MKLKEFGSKIKNAAKTGGKRTVIALMALVVIATAVVLNVILMKEPEMQVGNISDKLAPVASYLDSESEEVSIADYFSNIILNRKSAREEAMEVLSSVADNESAVEDVRNSAYSDMQQIALDIEREADIEALMNSKGFSECLAVVNGDTASIIVKTEGLTPSEVAQISEIVYTECGVLPQDLKIIEKN